MPHFLKALSAATAAMLTGGCLLCDQSPEAPDGIDLCRSCRATLPYNRLCCPRCALPLKPTVGATTGMASESPCESCAREPPPFTLTLAPLLYEGCARHWVHRLKQHFGLLEGRLLGNLMAEAFMQRRSASFPQSGIGMPLPQALVPVPLATWRLVRRGHNQSVTLAKPLSSRLGIPLYRLAVQRIRSTTAQRGLGRARRLANLEGAFRSRSWHGERIAIVDDVMTTGATVSNLARTLLEAGAGEVLVFCATRTAPAQPTYRY